jgi:hypothetical protein
MSKSHNNFQVKIVEKYPFVQGDLINNFYFRQFIIQCSFVYTKIEIEELTPKVLGQLAQQSL